MTNHCKHCTVTARPLLGMLLYSGQSIHRPLITERVCTVVVSSSKSRSVRKCYNVCKGDSDVSPHTYARDLAVENAK
jgi:hypothetical protein